MILPLTLYKQYFIAILTGEKKIEYRSRSEYWDKKLLKPYTAMHMVNGYGAKRPWLEAEIVRVEQTPEQWLIHIGNITGYGNLHLLCPAIRASSSLPSQ